MTGSPDVSIITPSYNQGEFIEETLQSVMYQDYDGVEHIVVDSESDDDTVMILESYEQKYDLHWVSEPDEGQADAVNKGINMANGEFIGWLNSDDIYVRRDAVSAASKRFHETEADAVYGDSLIIDRNSKVLKVRRPPRELHYKRLLHDCVLTQPSVFLRRDLLMKHPLNTGLEAAMDYDLWLRTAREYQYEHVNHIFSGDRTHQDRKTVKGSSEMGRESELLRERHSLKNPVKSISNTHAMLEGLYLRGVATPKLLEIIRDEDFILVDLDLKSLLTHLLFTQKRIENTF